MSLRTRVRYIVQTKDLEALEALVAANRRTIRYLMALTYDPDEQVRRTAARGIALASRYHPKLVQNNVRRLVWAMNEESGTNAVTAPEVCLAISRVRPRLLLPMLPDLIRLAADESLKEGLSATLREISRHCPGETSACLTETLNRRIRNSTRS